MIKVGEIKQIWRYPVKGMAGEQLTQCHLGTNGLSGDRIWALRDVARQEIQSCKFRPELLRCVAKLSSQPHDGPDNQVQIVFPDGAVMSSDDPNIHQVLSRLTGHESTLEALRPFELNQDFYRRHKKDDHTWLNELKATFERQDDEPLPDLDNLPQMAVDFVTLPGTFFLVTPFHMITTASLEHMQQLNKQADWAIERFRPNVVIDTLPGMTGLVEQAWLDQRLLLGETGVLCNGTTPRCGAITQPQQTCGKDTQVLRHIVKQADQNLGVYGAIEQPGMIHVGDAVYLNDAFISV